MSDITERSQKAESLSIYMARVEGRCKQIEAELQAAEQAANATLQARSYEQVIRECEELLQQHEAYPRKADAALISNRFMRRH